MISSFLIYWKVDLVQVQYILRLKPSIITVGIPGTRILKFNLPPRLSPDTLFPFSPILGLSKYYFGISSSVSGIMSRSLL